MRRLVILVVAGGIACGGRGGDSTVPFRNPGIVFDQSTYVVTLNASASAVASQQTPRLTIVRGSDALPPILIVGLDPSGGCTVGPGGGVGFGYNEAQWTIKGTETSVSEALDFNVCPSTDVFGGSKVFVKGRYPIHATYTWLGKAYVASASVVVQ